MNNYIYITVALLVVLGFYFFVYNKPVETFENKTPHISKIEFPKEGLIGTFISPIGTIPEIERKITKDPSIHSLTIKNGSFTPFKRLNLISNSEGMAVGFFFKIVNNYPTSQF